MYLLFLLLTVKRFKWWTYLWNSRFPLSLYHWWKVNARSFSFKKRFFHFSNDLAYLTRLVTITKNCLYIGSRHPVWPDLPNSCNFGEILKVIVILGVYLLFGKNNKLLWPKFNAIGQISFVVNDQILKIIKLSGHTVTTSDLPSCVGR